MWQHQELLLACRSSFMECVTAKDVDIKSSKNAKKKIEIKQDSKELSPRPLANAPNSRKLFNAQRLIKLLILIMLPKLL